MNEKFANLFALSCIIIVGGIMTIPSQYQGTIKPNTSKLQIWITVGENKKSEQNSWSERPITKSTSPVKQWTIKNTKKNDYPKQKPLGTNTINSTIVMVRWFPEDSIATIVNTIYYTRNGIEANKTLKWENGWYNLTLQSNYRNKQWVQERWFWLCQLQEKYHAPFIWKWGYKKVGKIYVVDKVAASKLWFTDAFLDPYKQAHYCMDVWDDAERKWRISTTFYAYNVRHKYKDDFIIK